MTSSFVSFQINSNPFNSFSQFSDHFICPRLSMSETKEDKELNDLKNEAKNSLDKLVLQKFPKKILEIEKLIVDSFDPKGGNNIKTSANIPIPDKPNGQTPQTSVTEDRTGLDLRVFLFPNGFNETNKHMWKLIKVVKPLLLDFLEDMRSLKFGIQLMIPKVEDGNNFGVEIQEKVIRSVRASETVTLSRLNQFSDYFESRGSIIAWIAQWPHSDDYRKCLEEYDQKFYLILCLMVKELRDDYIALNDLIVKNLDKIKNPRSLRETNIY